MKMVYGYLLSRLLVIKFFFVFYNSIGYWECFGQFVFLFGYFNWKNFFEFSYYLIYFSFSVQVRKVELYGFLGRIFMKGIDYMRVCIGFGVVGIVFGNIDIGNIQVEQQ